MNGDINIDQLLLQQKTRSSSACSVGPSSSAIHTSVESDKSVIYTPDASITSKSEDPEAQQLQTLTAKNPN